MAYYMFKEVKMFFEKLLTNLLIIIISSSCYAADKFVTKRDSSHRTETYNKVITYPLLFSNSVPAYDEINTQVNDILEGFGCQDLETATEQEPYLYDVFARIIGLNDYYVGIEVKVNIDCDAPHHPALGYYHLVFDSKNGDLIEMNDHLPYQTFNPDEPEMIVQYQKELAEIIYDEMKSSGTLKRSCYSNVSKEDAIQFIEYDYPEISGLARFQNVVIKTSPTIENQDCREILRVTYDKVKQYIQKDSQLHSWLD